MVKRLPEAFIKSRVRFSPRVDLFIVEIFQCLLEALLHVDRQFVLALWFGQRACWAGVRGVGMRMAVVLPIDQKSERNGSPPPRGACPKKRVSVRIIFSSSASVGPSGVGAYVRRPLIFTPYFSSK